MTQQIIWALHVEVEQKCESVSSLSVLVVPFPYCQGVTLPLDHVGQRRDVILSLWMDPFFFCFLSSVLSLLISPLFHPLLFVSLWGFSLQQVAGQSANTSLTVWRHGNSLWKQHSYTNVCLYTNRCEHMHSQMYTCHAHRTQCTRTWICVYVHIHGHKLGYKVTNLGHTHTHTLAHTHSHAHAHSCDVFATAPAKWVF